MRNEFEIQRDVLIGTHQYHLDTARMFEAASVPARRYYFTRTCVHTLREAGVPAWVVPDDCDDWARLARLVCECAPREPVTPTDRLRETGVPVAVGDGGVRQQNRRPSKSGTAVRTLSDSGVPVRPDVLVPTPVGDETGPRPLDALRESGVPTISRTVAPDAVIRESKRAEPRVCGACDDGVGADGEACETCGGSGVLPAAVRRQQRISDPEVVGKSWAEVEEPDDYDDEDLAEAMPPRQALREAGVALR
jgi:hypothetical protein